MGKFIISLTPVRNPKYFNIISATTRLIITKKKKIKKIRRLFVAHCVRSEFRQRTYYAKFSSACTIRNLVSQIVRDAQLFAEVVLSNARTESADKRKFPLSNRPNKGIYPYGDEHGLACFDEITDRMKGIPNSVFHVRLKCLHCVVYYIRYVIAIDLDPNKRRSPY